MLLYKLITMDFWLQATLDVALMLMFSEQMPHNNPTE